MRSKQDLQFETVDTLRTSPNPLNSYKYKLNIKIAAYSIFDINGPSNSYPNLA